jgi:hypothetical protein
VVAWVITVALMVIATSRVQIARQANHMNRCLAAPDGSSYHRFR